MRGWATQGVGSVKSKPEIISNIVGTDRVILPVSNETNTVGNKKLTLSEIPLLY